MRLLAAFYCVVFFSSCGKPAIDFEPIFAAEDARRADDPALHAAAYSDVPELRARAATAYGHIAKNACIEPLFDLLSDDVPAVQTAAAFALGQLAWHDDELMGRGPGIVSRLQRLLTSPDDESRRTAVEAIGKLAGVDAPMLLSAQLTDSAAAVRAETALGLFRAFYIVLARDATTQLPKLPDDTIKQLRALSADPDDEVRRSVVYYFSRFADDRFSSLLPGLIHDTNLWVRLFAVQAIKRAAVASDDMVAALVAAAADTEYEVRVAAVQALIGIKRPDAVPMTLLADPSHHVRAAFSDALGAGTPAGDTPLVQLLTGDTSVDVRAEALTNLINRRGAGAEDLVRTAVTDSSWVIRTAAVDAISALGPAAESILMTTIKDTDEHVRVSSLAALAAVDSPWAFDAVKSALSAPGLAERGTAVDTLVQRKEPERIAAAWSCYQSSSGRRWNDVRTELIDIFAADTSGEGEGYLRMALADPLPAIVSKVEDILKQRGTTDLPPLPPEQTTVTPYFGLRFTQNPVVQMKTTRGDFEIECFAQDAPIHTANFIGLVRDGYYNGLLWHRVVPNFVIQGGDKEGSGYGDDGYSVRAEINPQRYERGALGMPRDEDFDTGGSQVFFTHVRAPHLDGQYTVFGQIRSGLEVVDEVIMGDQILSATVMP